MHSVRARTSHSAALGLVLGVPKIFILDLDVALIYQWRWLEERGLIMLFEPL